MSTDQNSEILIKILEEAGLIGVTANGCDALSFISSVHKSVHWIWSDVDEPWYTIHDLRHSYKIIDYMLTLDKIFGWTNYEKILIFASALIHDVGMQYNKWGLAGKTKKIPVKSDLIRKLHTEHCWELIDNQISSKRKNEIPPLMHNGENKEKDALTRSAIIACAHSGNKYLNNLREGTHSTGKIPGKRLLAKPYDQDAFDLQLIAGYLRFCDEVHGDSLRINQPERVWSWDIDPISKLHWLSCIFTEKITLDVPQDTGVITVNIDWSVPRGANSNLTEQIQTLVYKMRELNIKKEFENIKAFFQDIDRLEWCNELKIIGTEQDPLSIAMEVDSNLKKFMIESEKMLIDLEQNDKQNVLDMEKYKRKENVLNVITLKKSDKFTGQKSLPLKENLKNWFKKISVPKQRIIKLNSGSYTDTYLNCRSLGANINLLKQLTDDLLQKLTSNKIKNEIEYILAVGTSAIPLAISISLLLKCKVTFTTGEGNYFKLEKEPWIESGKNILMIDDIISSGQVASYILDYLEKKYGDLGKIFHYSIFKLGREKIKLDKRISLYEYALEVGEVAYYTEKEISTRGLTENVILESDIFKY